jgi:transposase
LSVTDILNLPGWSVIDAEEHEDRYLILASPTQPRRSCPHCEQGLLIGHGKEQRCFHDLPCHGKRMTIQIHHQRYLCKHCQKTSFAPLSGIDDRHQMTERLVRYIERKAISTRYTFACIAEETGIDPGTVRRICLDYIAKQEQIRSFEAPSVLGIDEIYLFQEPRGIMTNVEARTIIELLAVKRD